MTKFKQPGYRLGDVLQECERDQIPHKTTRGYLEHQLHYLFPVFKETIRRDLRMLETEELDPRDYCYRLLDLETVYEQRMINLERLMRKRVGTISTMQEHLPQ